jgi:hypothetical protein
MRARRTGAAVAAVAVALVIVAGCSGDDESQEPSDPAPTSQAASAPPPVPSASSGAPSTDCADTDVTFEGGSSPAPLDVVSTAAVSLADGAAYTVYLADFEIDPSQLTLFTKPEVPAGGRLVTLAATVFNPEGETSPIEAGTELVHDLTDFDTLTFVVTEETPTELFGNNTGGEGTMTITAVGDVLCAEVDYRDDEKSLAGVVESPVKLL